MLCDPCGADKQAFCISEGDIGTAVPAVTCRLSTTCGGDLPWLLLTQINQTRALRSDVNWSRGRTAGSLWRNKL